MDGAQLAIVVVFSFSISLSNSSLDACLNSVAFFDSEKKLPKKVLLTGKLNPLNPLLKLLSNSMPAKGEA